MKLYMKTDEGKEIELGELETIIEEGTLLIQSKAMLAEKTERAIEWALSKAMGRKVICIPHMVNVLGVVKASDETSDSLNPSYGAQTC